MRRTARSAPLVYGLWKALGSTDWGHITPNRATHDRETTKSMEDVITPMVLKPDLLTLSDSLHLRGQIRAGPEEDLPAYGLDASLDSEHPLDNGGLRSTHEDPRLGP